MEASRFDDEPEENTGSRNYQKEAAGLLACIYDRVIPDLQGHPPTNEMGMQTVELLDTENDWESIGLMAMPCDGFPNPADQQAVGIAQFIEHPIEGTEMRHIAEAHVFVHPSSALEVALVHRMEDEYGRSRLKPEAYPLTPERIRKIAVAINIAKVKPVRIE